MQKNPSPKALGFVDKMFSEAVQRYPVGIADLFNEFGINEPVNKLTLATAVNVHGKPFTDKLYEMVSVNKANDSATGQQTKKDTFTTILNAASSILPGVMNLGAAWLNKKNTSPATPPVNDTKKTDKDEDKKILGMAPELVIGVAVVIVLAVSLFAISAMKKNK